LSIGRRRKKDASGDSFILVYYVVSLCSCSQCSVLFPYVSPGVNLKERTLRLSRDPITGLPDFNSI
jgi:hypothetical protein